MSGQTFAGMPKAENLGDQAGRGVVAPEVEGVTEAVDVGLPFLALCLGPVRPVRPARAKMLAKPWTLSQCDCSRQGLPAPVSHQLGASHRK